MDPSKSNLTENVAEMKVHDGEMVSTEICQLPMETSVDKEKNATFLKNSKEIEIADTLEESTVKNNPSDGSQKQNCSQIIKSHEEGVVRMENIINSDKTILPNSSDGQTVLNFKTPTLMIGPRKGKPGKLRTLTSASTSAALVSEKSSEIPESADTTEKDFVEKTETVNSAESKLKDPLPPIAIPKEKQIVLPYREPVWGGIPEKKYKLEILKSGVILETIDLTLKSFYVFGRLPICDIPLAHPTISRYHAVIQYRLKGDEKNPRGLYLFDLGSTHGSFWNGHRMKSNMYVRVRSGHMIRFGCSQRKFIIHGPTEDEEEESELTVTELKENRRLELEERQRKEREDQLRKEEEERLKKEKEESEGIDWGMGEDADEETDLSENPYAATNNEELFLDDPKKTLRGWFEREGFDLQYQTEEKGIGQFLCWVELPIDNITGKSVRAEALVKGKKKESVIQCALEACRILDRHGVLRQAHHEARKRKVKNWEDEDFYDSDEDNFLDRTGAIEKKRMQRMRVAGKLEDTVETYTSLLEKHKVVVNQIKSIEKDLQSTQKQRNSAEPESSDEDALDAFMSNLKSVVFNKSEIIKMKLDLQALRKEETRLINLVNIAKPANLPPLKPQKATTDSTHMEETQSAKVLPAIGSRKKFKPMKDTTKSAIGLSDAADEEDDKIEDVGKSENERELINIRLLEAYKSNLTEPGEPDEEITEMRSTSIEKSSTTDSEKNIEDGKRTDGQEDVKLSEEEERLKEETEALKKKKRNQKRIQQRLEKAEKDKLKGYEEDMFKEDYSMWVPPQGQTGDGKTNLNDKFGY